MLWKRLLLYKGKPTLWAELQPILAALCACLRSLCSTMCVRVSGRAQLPVTATSQGLASLDKALGWRPVSCMWRTQERTLTCLVWYSRKYRKVWKNCGGEKTFHKLCYQNVYFLHNLWKEYIRIRKKKIKMLFKKKIILGLVSKDQSKKKQAKIMDNSLHG